MWNIWSQCEGVEFDHSPLRFTRAYKSWAVNRSYHVAPFTSIIKSYSPHILLPSMFVRLMFFLFIFPLNPFGFWKTESRGESVKCWWDTYRGKQLPLPVNRDRCFQVLGFKATKGWNRSNNLVFIFYDSSIDVTSASSGVHLRTADRASTLHPECAGWTVALLTHVIIEGRIDVKCAVGPDHGSSSTPFCNMNRC